MSKQSEAKERQNYQGKPLSRRCRECVLLESTEVQNVWGGISERLRCKLGGFKVTANAVCDNFLRRGN
jgi:hypothetical protein